MMIPGESRDDTDLLLAAGRGDAEAFGLLADRHHRTVVQFVARFLGLTDPTVADDLAQDVFLAAWKAAPGFRPRAKASTWLLRITTNHCLNYRRNRRLRVTLPLDADEPFSQPGRDADRPDALALASEQTRKVADAVAALPDSQRGAIILRHFHGLSYAAIADVLEISVPAVESLLFRARQTLREVLVEPDAGISPQVVPQMRVQ